MGHALTSEWSVVSVAVAIASCLLAGLAGLAAQDPLLRVAGPVCAGLELIALPVRLQVDAGLPLGILLVEEGFVLLAAGLINPIAGEAFNDRVGAWWRSLDLAPDRAG